MTEALHDADLVLITGGVGLFVNIIGLFLFHNHSHGGSHGHSHGGSHGHSHSGGGSHGHAHGGKKKKKKKKKKGKSKHEELVPVASGTADEGEDEKLIHQQQQPSSVGNSTVQDVDIVPHDEKTDETDDEESKQAESSGSLNMRGVYLHVLGDALGSVIVMISALIIKYQHGDWTKFVDPSLSIIMVMIILKTSFPLLKESSMILMQTVPTHMKIQEIQDALMESVPGILSVHEFHIWQLAGNKIIASAHVHCKTMRDYMQIAGQVKEFFHNQGIHSTTIQPEFVEPMLETSREMLLEPDMDGVNEDSCLLECEETCSERMCCGSTITTNSAPTATSSPSMVASRTDVGGVSSSLSGSGKARTKNVPV